MSAPDRFWSVVDPMGHEHRWVDDELPTLDSDNRCLRCGHKVEPRYMPEPMMPSTPGRGRIVSVNIEARAESVDVISSTGSREHIPGLTRYYMTANDVEFEISQAEARMAGEAYRRGVLDVYASDLLKKYGFSFA
jgi:hypothetical protein